MPFDKYVPVQNILEDPNLTTAGKFLLIMTQVPTCICGTGCRLYRYLLNEFATAQAKEEGKLIPGQRARRRSQ
jgi:hypothetical protein